MTAVRRKAGRFGALVILVLALGNCSGVRAAGLLCEPEITSFTFARMQASGSGYSRAGTLGWVSVGDFFSIEIEVTNCDSTPVNVGNPYRSSISSGQSRVAVVGQACMCASWGPLQPGQSLTLTPFCCQAWQALAAGEVAIDIDLGNCIWTFTFEIQGGGGPVTCQPEVTDIRIVKLQPSGNSFTEVGEVSEVTVGDYFTVKVDVTNSGGTAVSVDNLYGYTLSGQGDADVVGQLSVCLFPMQLQPGQSATLKPFCGGNAFQATTAGLVTMDITVGANCHDSFTFEVRPSAAPPVCQPEVTDVRILRRQAAGDEEVSEVTVGDTFTVEVDVMNRGTTPVGVGSPYQWSFSPQGRVDLVGQGCLCAGWWQLQPGESRTLKPACCQDFQATTAGTVAMNITVGANCPYSFTFEIKETGGLTDPSLVLYMPFDENAGYSTGDLSMYHNPGYFTVGTLWVPGIRGTALEFGQDMHLNIPEIPQYDVTSAVSVLAWIKTTQSPFWGRVLDKSEYPNNGFDLCLMDSSIGLPRFEFFVNNLVSAVTGTTKVMDGQWHFLAGTFGNKTLRMYVDGKKEGEARSTGNMDIKTNNWPIWIGSIASGNGAQQYYGTIDEVAMYNRELSADEVMSIFQNGMLAKCQPEVTKIKIVKLQRTGSGFSQVGQVSEVALGDYFTIDVEVTNRSSAPVPIEGNIYGWSFSGPGHVDVVTAQFQVCLAGPGTLQPGGTASLIPFCGGTAFQATAAGSVTMDISENGCHQTFSFEIKAGAAPAACQPEITSVKIMRLQMSGSYFKEVGEISSLSVGDFFTLKVEVVNRGSTSVRVSNPYAWSVVGQSHADVVGNVFCNCATSWQLQPGQSATLTPYCEGCRAFWATTPGTMTMDITVGANCHNQFMFEILQ